MLVRLFLVGLIALVEVEGGVTVLVRDARTYEYIDGHCVEPHMPILWWDAECEGGCPSGAKFELPRCPSRGMAMVEEEDLWVLDREELSVCGVFEGKPELCGVVNGQLGTGSAHLAEMNEIASKKGHAACAQKWTENAPPGLVARWTLTGDTGVVRVQACHLVTFDDAVAVVDFKRGFTKKWGDPVADIALVELKVETDVETLRLSATRFYTEQVRSVLLKPKDGNPITLVLSNQPPETDREEVGRHFEYFYGFSQEWPKWKWRRRIPHVADTDDSAEEYVNKCEQYSDDEILEDLVEGGVGRAPAPLRNLGNRPICPLADF